MKFIKQINWIAFIPQLIVIMIFARLWQITQIETPFLFGALSYLVLSYILRTTIPRTHRLGIALIKHKEYEAAIDCFKASFLFFGENSWIDDFRPLTLLTVSKTSYREMALLNIAHCYFQLGDAKKEKECYETILKRFPESVRAMEALKQIEEYENLPTAETIDE